MAINIFQIYYDESTRQALDPGFIPLDNCRPERPDWFEFWPIRKLLKETRLNDNSWYGVVSPRFTAKTGFTSSYITEALEAHHAQVDVALFSSTWDFIAYYTNVFEQGEVWHEGITEVAQQFYDAIGHPVNLAQLVHFSKNSVTSNYIVAKPNFWRRWLYFADKLLEVSESQTPLGAILRGDTTYGPRAIPFKVFIQERLAPVILATEPHRLLVPEQSYSRPLFTALFHDDLTTRKKLQACDLLKELYVSTGDAEYLKTYIKVKQTIPIKPTKFR